MNIQAQPLILLFVFSLLNPLICSAAETPSANSSHIETIYQKRQNKGLLPFLHEAANSNKSLSKLGQLARNNTKLLCCIGIAITAGYIGYRCWKSKQTNGTQNLADAIYKGNNVGIEYWLSKTTDANVDDMCFVENGLVTGKIGPIKIYKVAPHPITALEAALQRKNEKIIKLLLAQDANPNLVDYPGIYHDLQHSNFLELFLNHGLNPNKKYRLLYVSSDHTSDPVNHKHCFKSSLMAPAILTKNKKAVVALIEHGARDINVQGYPDYTELGDRVIVDFTEEQRTLVKEASKLVKRKHLTPLAGISIQSAEILSKGVRDKVANFLTTQETQQFYKALDKKH